MIRHISFLITIVILLNSFAIRGQVNLETKDGHDTTLVGTEAIGELTPLFKLDVFNFYKLSEYDTDLKKEMFRKTDSYKNYLSQLTILRDEAFKTIYFVCANTYEGQHIGIGDYDVKRRGFNLKISDDSEDRYTHPKTYGISGKQYLIGNVEHYNFCYISLNALPIKVIPHRVLDMHYREELFLPVDEATGLEIENSKDDVGLFFFFTPTSFDKKMDLLKTNRIRVVIANRKTNKLYFDRTYSQIQAKNK